MGDIGREQERGTEFEPMREEDPVIPELIPDAEPAKVPAGAPPARVPEPV